MNFLIQFFLKCTEVLKQSHFWNPIHSETIRPTHGAATGAFGKRTIQTFLVQTLSIAMDSNHYFRGEIVVGKRSPL